jgi:hypothetical protein
MYASPYKSLKSHFFFLHETRPSIFSTHGPTSVPNYHKLESMPGEKREDGAADVISVKSISVVSCDLLLY